MLRSIGAISSLACAATAGMAWRTSISPETYQPLSTLDTNEQLSNVDPVCAQSPWPGLRMTCPVLVSYHW